jgi:hypothetical protein
METFFPVESAFNVSSDKVKVENRTLKEVMQDAPMMEKFRHGMVVLDSRSITKTATDQPVCHAYRQYAFSNISIPSGQLLYYCQNATQSGDATKVSWSMILRDLVASRSTASDISSTGNPIASQEREWCAEPGHGPCPGLACELQVRCPLPVLTTFGGEDSYLKDPSRMTEIPQIPPVPADML